MNAKELAQKTGLHYNTVYKMIKEGFIKAERVGKSYIVDDEEAARFIKIRIPYVEEQIEISSANTINDKLKQDQVELILKIALLSKNFTDEFYENIKEYEKDLEKIEVEKVLSITEKPIFIELIKKFKKYDEISLVRKYLNSFRG